MIPSINVQDTGENLRRLLSEKDISVKAVQEYLGLSGPQSIYKWFKGKGLPSIDNLYALSSLLNVSVDQLICGSSPDYREYFHELEISFLKRVFHYYIRTVDALLISPGNGDFKDTNRL